MFLAIIDRVLNAIHPINSVNYLRYVDLLLLLLLVVDFIVMMVMMRMEVLLMRRLMLRLLLLLLLLRRERIQAFGRLRQRRWTVIEPVHGDGRLSPSGANWGLARACARGSRRPWTALPRRQIARAARKSRKREKDEEDDGIPHAQTLGSTRRVVAARAAVVVIVLRRSAREHGRYSVGTGICV